MSLCQLIKYHIATSNGLGDLLSILPIFVLPLCFGMSLKYALLYLERKEIEALKSRLSIVVLVIRALMLACVMPLINSAFSADPPQNMKSVSNFWFVGLIFIGYEIFSPYIEAELKKTEEAELKKMEEAELKKMEEAELEKTEEAELKKMEEAELEKMEKAELEKWRKQSSKKWKKQSSKKRKKQSSKIKEEESSK